MKKKLIFEKIANNIEIEPITSVNNEMDLIDLFAGCGGLSLGLKEAGIKPILANELEKNVCLTYKRNFLKTRLIEGDIRVKLTNTILKRELENIKEDWEKNPIDLVAGGPPCQGYSLAGRRKSVDTLARYLADKLLYKEMIRVINFVKPRAFLLENVSGILSAKWSKTDKKGTVFMTVWNDFVNDLGDNYIIRPQLLKSSDYGIPQKRVRFFLIGIKQRELEHRFKFDSLFLSTPKITSPSDVKNKGFFPNTPSRIEIAPNPIEVIGDLDFNGWTKDNQYHQKKVESDFQKRMRIKVDRKKKPELKNHELTKHTEKARLRFKHIQSGKKLDELPKNLQSKKIIQRALPKTWESEPNITITSMPDDLIHYKEPRILSVRECARFQTFPDHFVFHGVRTIGGKQRGGDHTQGIERVIPQYTQVANAVPPLLAKFLGREIRKLLKPIS